MSNIVQITFMGLIAFVPGPGGSGLTVIVPDLSQPYEASDGSMIPSHRALLVYQCADLKGGCTADDLDAATISEVYQTWDSTLFVPGKWGARRLTGLDLAIAPQQTYDDVFKLDTESHIKDFAPDNAVIDPTFLLKVDQFKAATTYADATAARLTLSKGVDAEVDGWVSRAQTHVKAGFGPLSTTTDSHPQELADSTTVSIQVHSGATVAFTPFRLNNDPPQNPLTLNQGGTGAVTLYILNLAVCKQWTGVMGDIKACNEDRTDEGTQHFEAYYELSKTRPFYRNRFVPAKKDIPGVLTHDRPICPSAMFERQ